MTRLAPWDFNRVVRLPDVAPEHPTARLARADITQSDTWREAEQRVENEATVELTRELRRRAGLRSDSIASTNLLNTDIVVTSKTVRRLWLPIYECKYSLSSAQNAAVEEEFVCFVNAQTGRCYGERPAVNRPALVGAVGLSAASLSVMGLVAYKMMRNWN